MEHMKESIGRGMYVVIAKSLIWQCIRELSMEGIEKDMSDRNDLLLNTFEHMASMASNLERIVDLLEAQQHSDHVHAAIPNLLEGKAFSDDFYQGHLGPEYGDLIRFEEPNQIVDFKTVVEEQVRNKLRQLLGLMNRDDWFDVKAWIAEQLQSDHLTDFPTNVISIQRTTVKDEGTQGK